MSHVAGDSALSESAPIASRPTEALDPPRRWWGRSLPEWFASLPVFGLLLLTLVVGTGEMIHGQLLRVGEAVFGDPTAQVQYFMLRAEPVKPDCAAEGPGPVSASPSTAPSAPDDIDALFGAPAAQDPQALQQAQQQAQAICRERLAMYERVLAHQTPWLVAYRSVETSFHALFHLGADNRPLILLAIVAIAAISTTLGFHHLAIRPAHHGRDYLVQSIAQLLAAGLLLASCVSYYRILSAGGAQIDKPYLHALWIALMAVLVLINAWRCLRPVASRHGPGRWGAALLSLPLYALMAIVAGVYFLWTGHPAGLAIYINQLMELPNIFLNLGLFIWAGMLFKQCRVVDLFMDLLRPWRLSPQLLTYIILLAAALPTAYTGASGIFVIAAGAIVYHEVRAAGGRRQFAMAATAMSGSLGVVLRPCLLVVLIAALNKQVTTNGLYHWGFYVFLLTSTLFFLASQLLRTERASIEAPAVAIPATLRAVVPTLPYVALTIAVVLFYRWVLDTPLNEITAPTIIPILMLLLLVLDKLLTRGKPEPTPDYGAHRQPGVEASVRYATNETLGHIGALLCLMMLSLAVGGVIERSEVMSRFPQVFESPWIAMAFLVVVKVAIGAVMDPFGAVVLVSSTLAPIAMANGIDPLHFWMMVLLAFELGYLFPPVALNQLLARQVIGEREVYEADREVRHLGLYRRYERWILPLAVMSVALLIVAFGPLAVKDLPALAFIGELFPAPKP